MKTLAIATTFLVGTAIGNFSWQYFMPVPDYSTAFAYTYHQTWAVAFFSLGLWVFREKKQP